MNYIQLLNSFLAHESSLRSTHVSAFMAIFYIANRSGWKQWVKISAAQAKEIAKIDKNTWYKTLQDLENEGIIKTQKGEKSSTMVSINDPALWFKPRPKKTSNLGENSPRCENELGENSPSTWGKFTKISPNLGENSPTSKTKTISKQEEVFSFQKKQEPKTARTHKAQPQQNSQPAPIKLPKLKSL